MGDIQVLPRAPPHLAVNSDITPSVHDEENEAEVGKPTSSHRSQRLLLGSFSTPALTAHTPRRQRAAMEEGKTGGVGRSRPAAAGAHT